MRNGSDIGEKVNIAGTHWSTRRYMNMERLNEAKIEAYGAVVA